MAQPYADRLGDAAENTGRAAGLAEEAMKGVKETAAEAMDRATAIAGEAIENPEKFARDTYVSVARYAREKPIEALAITAGVAFVIGALWKR